MPLTNLRQSAVGRWFADLERREQRLIAGAAAAVGAALVYFAVWSPISTWAAQAETRHAQALGVLDYLRAHEAEARAAGRGPTGTTSAGGSMLSAIAETAASAGIQLTRYQNEAGGGMSVVLQDQSFDQVLTWLADLERNGQARVRQLSIDAQGTPGRINARISLI